MLILAATPIGHASDASPRLAEALATADVIAAEDTRRVQRLLARLNVTPAGKVLSYFEGNETRRTGELIHELEAGADVVVVTDAGMPSVSDPGYRLVTAAIETNIDVTTLPGPSAVLAALAVSGLPVDRFCFEGFPARKSGERDRALAALADEPRTMVFFESPHRTKATLEAMARAWGESRRLAVCRELTKTYEEVQRGTVAELIDWCAEQEQQHGIRGEITIVAAGASPSTVTWDAAALRQLVDERHGQGMSRKDAIRVVAQHTGVRRHIVYEAAHN